MSTEGAEREQQRHYYESTATRYESLHVSAHDHHAFALGMLAAACDFAGVATLLDIGSGTGRVVGWMHRERPSIRTVGVEPVAALREVGYAQGIARGSLVEGDAYGLPFGDGSFDIVCAFGMLHHVRTPTRVVDEMLRVAAKGVFISDSNNFGQGSPFVRTLKQLIHMAGLWPLANWLKTGGRGYTLSEGDGLAYSYSVFSNYQQISERCRSVHVFNTSPGGINPYRTACQVALLGFK